MHDRVYLNRRVLALGDYDGALRAAILALKRGERAPIEPFAALLAERFAKPGAIVPVPTTRARRAERGFDQSRAVAQRYAEITGVPLIDLLKKRAGPAQHGRTRERRLAACGRFRLVSGPGNRSTLPSRIVLFDDVCTTGATLRDAERALAEAGIAVSAWWALAISQP